MLSDRHNGMPRIVEKEKKRGADAAVLLRDPIAAQLPLAQEPPHGRMIAVIGHFFSLGAKCTIFLFLLLFYFSYATIIYNIRAQTRFLCRNI